MRASDWEFKNRAMVFGIMLGIAFPMYRIDPLRNHSNVVEVFSNWIAPRLQWNPDALLHGLFWFAAFLLVAAAFLRTWASSFLRADVVYASQVKTAALVADGPYRQMRNPLYFANLLMALGMGAMMSRVGFAFVVVAMVVFTYRLIFREEAELLATQGESYRRYLAAVPRLLPALFPRIPASGAAPRWADGFKAESWYWGFAASVVAFAITLNLLYFFVILAASLALFGVMSAVMQKKQQPTAAP
jgi:protein-S-isoprenylcysteine O-methyltransferase Ste14